MLRVVLDTNIAISALLRDDSVPAKVLFHCLHHTQICSSEETFNELWEKCHHSKFSGYISPKERMVILTSIEDSALWFNPTVRLDACRDDDDNRLLELALAANADVLVTGDKDLLVLEQFHGTAILTPKAFQANFMDALPQAA